MRKSLIAQSVAALIGGLGLAAVANAGVVSTGLTPPAGVPLATQLVVNTDGLGHINLVPYYSTASGNDTYINITNTDTLNGKAIKVRFRGASNSDDVYDITVLMSPGDVWAAAISKDAATGLPKLNHNDKTCTLPFNVKGTFVTSRLDKSAGITDAMRAEQASEGYVEILNMADIPPGSDLYDTIKHTDGEADCDSKVLGPLFTNMTTAAEMEDMGLFAPTTGLMTNWTIINVPKAASYTGAAVAVEARTAATGPTTPGVAGYGNIVFFPQAATPVNLATAQTLTSDPLLRTAGATATVGIVPASMFDFPDLSTPYLSNGLDPVVQASNLTAALAVSSVANEFVTDPSILAKTDWVFSMPTRRYSVAFDYSAAATSTNRLRETILPVNFFRATSATFDGNVTIEGRQLCVSGINIYGDLGNNYTSPYIGDREETSLSDPFEFVISPGEPAAPLTFCGEVSVLGFNGTSALGAKVTTKDVDLSAGGLVDGWMRINTPGLSAGLPVIGNMFTELFNGAATAGTAGAYGQTFPHRATRPVAP
jgi:hypothetical protein